MAFDAFLYFPKQPHVKGETLDSVMSSKHAFELLSFTFGAENTTSIGSGSGGAGAGKATFKDFTITKRTDTASCGLFKTCVSGNHFEQAIIELRRAGGDDKKNSTFMKISFKMVIVKDMEWSGSDGDDLCEETVIFQFGAIKIEYMKQDSDGNHKKADGQAGEVVWSQKLNEPNFSVER